MRRVNKVKKNNDINNILCDILYYEMLFSLSL